LRGARIALLIAVLAAGAPAAVRARGAAPPDSAALNAAPPDTGASNTTPPDTAVADTARSGGMLERLQRQDQDFYPGEALDLDRSLADSGLAALDSLGFKTFARESRRRALGSGFELGLGGKLDAYNRVEGGVESAHLIVRTPLGYGTRLDLEAGYAEASERFRHYESLAVPLTFSSRGPELEAGWADRVVPYGSNRPTANGLRAYFGSADEQDYLRRRGGWGGVAWEGSPVGALRLRYEAAREISVATHSHFGLFGNPRLMGPNPPVGEGIDRAVTARVKRGSLMGGHVVGTLDGRVSGGALGGDFAYTRFDFEGGLRRYLWLDQELVLDAGYTRTGSSPPVQRLADVGGLSTVRGFDRRTRVGRESAHARAELLLPYDVFAASRLPLLRRARIQLVPWADAGRVWRGNGDGWLVSAGLGLQRYLGPFGEGSYLRLDAALPLGPDRPEDVRYYLRFARGLF